MDRLTGFGPFVMTAGIVLGVLRVVHISVPLVVPSTRPGPVSVTDFDDARRQLGFAAVIPAYRPQSLGERPAAVVVRFTPWPTLETRWENGGETLAVTQRRGGPPPPHPPLARPFDDRPDSLWWLEAGQSHAVVRYRDFWIEIGTTGSLTELRRFTDTLSPVGR